MKRILSLLVAMSIALFFAGCLSVEEKEYSWTINDNGRGTAKIIHKNIYSSGNIEEDLSAEDFVSLIDDYLEGGMIDDDYPGAKNMKKRLYIEDEKLCGEVTFEFDELSDIGFYRHKGEGPFMFIVETDEEIFIESDGDWAGESFPVVFWPDKTEEFNLTTSVGSPEEDGTKFLLDYYNTWMETGEMPDIDSADE